MNTIIKPVKILIVDDTLLIRKYIGQLIRLEADLQVCGEAQDQESALRAIEELKPDMVLVDISFGGNEAGIELMREIHSRNKDLPTLALSLHEEALYGQRVREAGARGYLMKQEAPEYLITAIRHVLSGKHYVHCNATSSSGPSTG